MRLTIFCLTESKKKKSKTEKEVSELNEKKHYLEGHEISLQIKQAPSSTSRLPVQDLQASEGQIGFLYNTDL